MRWSEGAKVQRVRGATVRGSVNSEAEPTLVLVTHSDGRGHVGPAAFGGVRLAHRHAIAPRLRRPALVADGTMSGYTRDLIDTLDRLRIERAVFGGLSLGGYVLFELLRQAPGRG